jgi:hypothetical protein
VRPTTEHLFVLVKALMQLGKALLKTVLTPSRSIYRGLNTRSLGIDTMAAREPRRFAPLNPDKATNGAPKLLGIVFDVDGTLCEYVYYFYQVRHSS